MNNDNNGKKKAGPKRTKQNVLESLKDLGGSAGGSIKNDLLKKTSEDFFRELMGAGPTHPKRTGEMTQGNNLDMSEVLSGKEEENRKLRAQISLERRLSEDEKKISQEKTQELKVQLQAIIQEVQKVAASTGNLAEQIQVAAMQAPANPGIYHLTFFENLLEFLRSFRKKIDNASIWLNSTNKRAQKKNYWNTYKKKGSSFLLSPDHYLQRSAG